MLQISPLHPDGQEQVFGPTHFPLFMHMGSHTPKTLHKHVQTDYMIERTLDVETNHSMRKETN